MLTVTIREEIESFLKAWDNYIVEIKAVFLLGSYYKKNDILGQRPDRFNSLKEVDKYFHSYVQPLVKRFFERNPSIHRGCGAPEVIEIYNKYAGHCPYLLNPSRLGKKDPAPPRLHLPHAIEGWKDVLLLTERCYTKTRDTTTLLMRDLTNQWKDYQDLVLALVRREEGIQAVPKIDGTVSKREASPPLRLKVVRNENVSYWGDQFLPIKGKHFDILFKLAQNTGKIVLHHSLYSLINSQHHKDPLLRQYMNDIRKAFPPPYSNPTHPEGIIKTRKMEGYYLDLPPERVEII